MYLIRCPHCGKTRKFATRNPKHARALCFCCGKTFTVYHYGKKKLTNNIVKRI